MTNREPLEIGTHSADEIRKKLRTVEIDGSGGLEAYADEDCERFIRTLQLIPPEASTVLEIGANPYFISVLARWFRPDLTFTYTNYFGPQSDVQPQTVEIDGLNGAREALIFTYKSVNVEEDELPSGPFDCVLFCEVLEHMTNDPLHPLKEINRVLADRGTLILTTPNVARLENIARLMGGHNLYDPYSGYGPYGRHNREYTKHELALLLKHSGFEPEILATHDVHENRYIDYFPQAETLLPLVEFRNPDLGQYHFTRSTKVGQPAERRPAWLFRSYPSDELI